MGARVDLARGLAMVKRSTVAAGVDRSAAGAERAAVPQAARTGRRMVEQA
jgi:hypothetical protein